MAEAVGASAKDSFETIGALGIMFFKVLHAGPRYHTIIEQFVQIGISSLPITLLSSTFVGFIATWQVKYLAGDIINFTSYLGMVVLKVVVSELGPTLIGLVLAGRIGAKLAAEVGTMRVSEQIDAMICLSLDPIKYIIAPKVWAGFVMVPVLFIFGSLAAIVSAQLLATLFLGVAAPTFYNSMHLMFNIYSIIMGLVKSFVFGGITALCGCYFGYTAKGGAEGVGAATRRSVVSASILILISNLIISQMFM
jgi:phospholipid/cholesterol/gamma-HCH transport system permease protein